MEKFNFIHVEPVPFEGLKVIIADDLTVLMTVAASRLILETKRIAWEKGLCSIGIRELFFTLMCNTGTESVAEKVLQKLGVDTLLGEILIYHRVSIGGKEKASIDDIRFDNNFHKLIRKAMEIAKDSGQNYIWTNHLLLALLDDEEEPKFLWSPKKILTKVCDVTPDKIILASNQVLGEFNSEEETQKESC